MTTASPLSRGADATKIRAPDKHAYPGPSTAFISSSPVLRLVGRSFAGEKLIAAHALVASEKFFRHANDPHHIDPTAYLEKLLTQASPDLMREMLGDFINQILSTQADAVCDADYGTTSGNRVNHRNGYRRRPLDTRVGTVDVAIPKLAVMSFIVTAIGSDPRQGFLCLSWCCCNLGREPRKLRFYCVINAMCLCCQAVSNTRLTITASGFG